MGYYNSEIEKAVVLTLFLPLIISSGGNSGSQAATLIVRALAVGEVHLRDWWWVVRREVFSGVMLGLLLGTIGFLRIVIWRRFYIPLYRILVTCRLHRGDLVDRRGDMGYFVRISITNNFKAAWDSIRQPRRPLSSPRSST